MTALPPKPSHTLPASFNLSSTQLEHVRMIAAARDVSMSHVVRDALELAMALWTTERPAWSDDERDGRPDHELDADPEPARRTRSIRRPPTRVRIRPSDG